MSIDVDIQTACEEPTPDKDTFRRWLNAVLEEEHADAELCLRLVSCEEMSNLNKTYRGKSSTTNVLAFPANLPSDVDSRLLGDIVICAEVVNREAEEQHKTSEAHWAHMVVHGTLHLLGYDHVARNDARLMESRETDILRQLDFDCPYEGGLTTRVN